MSKISDGRIAVFGLLAVAVWLYVVLPLGYLSWLSMAEKPTETIAGIGSLGWTAIGATANFAYDLLTLVRRHSDRVSAARGADKSNPRRLQSV
jgi:hypothetical protein